MEGKTHVTNLEEAKEFFANPENEGKHCHYVMPDETEAAIVSVENAESFFAELEEKAAAGETTNTTEEAGAATEETTEEKSADGVSTEDAGATVEETAGDPPPAEE